MKEPASLTDDDARAAAASHIAGLAAELAQIARLNKFDTLGYLLEMARLEADNLVRGSNGHRSRSHPS
jgi:hypothetical protein